MRLYPAADLLAVFESTPFARRFDFDPEVAVRLAWRGIPILNLPTGIPYVTPPASRPVTNPILARQPNVPQADGGRPSAPPIRTRQPNVPPIRVNQPNVPPIGGFTVPRSPLSPAISGGSPIPPASGVPMTGSHLWQRRSR